MTSRSVKAFQDDPDAVEPAQPPWAGAWSAFWPRLAKALAWLTIIVAAMTAWRAVSGCFAGIGDLDVYLRGPGVTELHPGGWVVIGCQQVGRVAGFEVREGEQVAHLGIEGRYRSQIPSRSRFEVCSLNVWWPGRVGVRISAPEDSAPNVPVPDGALVQTCNTVLPVDIPPRFYLLVVLMAVALVLLVLVGRALRSVATIVSGIAIIVAVVVHLSGLIS